ncbi:RING finger protein 141-like [Sitophilus oryzae]|uniref:RING finger protein 141 n=1 Tax=Sitophilus oryzae TaxID=7048 RepID=A0A6J2YVH5_SITOR|nr:RING finger protein 141-like [Sitophilus oryzae]XP_030767282.1 RING finger protein 141-like [Sitophilus oryzae]
MGDVLSQVISDEPSNTLLTSEICNLTYEEFLALLWELNTFAKKCLDSNGHQLVFAVKKHTDDTAFWKATIQIACAKIDCQSRKVVNYRLLSLSEFLKVFKTFQCQVLAAEQSKSTNSFSQMNLSTILDNVDLTTFPAETGDECIICFERKQEVTLPCAHSYCTQCIEEWNESHDTCPICREKLESTDDTWVISEVPNVEEISNEIRENLLELTEDKPPVCNPS